MIRRAILWASGGLVAFTYVGAPVVILMRGALRPRPVAAAPIEPTVAVVIAAHDEADGIAARLTNLAAQDYPADRMQVVVASDGSTDRTVTIARAAAGPRVTVLDLPRVGKADALNAAIAASSSEVVVFTDANTRFAPDAIRAIVRPLADRTVGGVAGNQVYLDRGGGSSEVGERSYWDLDRAIKRAESAAGSTVSATGALYAMRRELVPTIVAGVTDDFYTSTAVIERGARLVFAEDAVAYEPPAPSTAREYRRKVRIISRGFRGVAARAGLLDPRRTGFYAVQLAWHKVLRRLMAIPVLLIGLMSLTLIGEGRRYRAMVAAQAIGYAAAAIGLVAPHSRIGRTKPVSIGSFFVMVNLAAVHAAMDTLQGKRVVRWEPARTPSVALREGDE